jgi:hypothetical protein
LARAIHAYESLIETVLLKPEVAHWSYTRIRERPQ